jgi:hypothetical protein
MDRKGSKLYYLSRPTSVPVYYEIPDSVKGFTNIFWTVGPKAKLETLPDILIVSDGYAIFAVWEHLQLIGTMKFVGGIAQYAL